MGSDELIKCSTDFIWEALQHVDTEDMADELDEACLAVLIESGAEDLQ
nr:hypothetical protein PJ912_12535 [Pectobacterium colocasium]